MEKRRLTRKNLIYYLKVVDRRTGTLVGKLADISLEGIMLIHPEPIPVGRTYELRLDLPEHMEVKGPIDFSAQSKWSKKDLNPDFYAAGFQFTDIRDKDVEILKQLIEIYLLPK